MRWSRIALMATSNLGTPVEDRLRTLENKALKVEIWLKVALGIAVALGLSGAYLFQRAANLTSAYDGLADKQKRLDTELTAKAVIILEKAAPEVLRLAMSDAAAVFCTSSNEIIPDSGKLRFPICEYGAEYVTHSPEWSFKAPRTGVYLIHASMSWADDAAERPSWYGLFLHFSSNPNKAIGIAGESNKDHKLTAPQAVGGFAALLSVDESIWIEAEGYQRRSGREVHLGTTSTNYVSVVFVRPN
jgi:hypothetical protein